MGNEAFHLAGHLWVLGMFGVLAFLEANKVGLFLVPPFGATLSILLLLPDAAIAQPYALIVGSVAGAAVGTLISLFAHGLAMAVLAAIVAFGVMILIRAYHPPGIALALYPLLLHTAAGVALGSQAKALVDYFEECRRKRNVIDYTGVCISTATEAAEVLQRTKEFREMVEAWIKVKHAQFA